MNAGEDIRQCWCEDLRRWGGEKDPQRPGGGERWAQAMCLWAPLIGPRVLLTRKRTWSWEGHEGRSGRVVGGWGRYDQMHCMHMWTLKWYIQILNIYFKRVCLGKLVSCWGIVCAKALRSLEKGRQSWREWERCQKEDGDRVYPWGKWQIWGSLSGNPLCCDH